MPPLPDRHLEDRILKAAQRLWRTRGNKGLTLRAVAKEAGTTTPTIYQRFRNKEALQLALALRVRDTLNAELFSSTSLEEAARRYLRFAEAHPHEYELLGRSWTKLGPQDGSRPGRAWLLSELAARFGGQPEEYGPMFYPVLLLFHGAASLLTSQGDPAVHQEIRESCMGTLDKLLENAAVFRARSSEFEWSGS